MRNPTTSLTPNPTKSPTLNPTKSATQNPTGPPTPNPTTPPTPSPVAPTATGEPTVTDLTWISTEKVQYAPYETILVKWFRGIPQLGDFITVSTYSATLGDYKVVRTVKLCNKESCLAQSRDGEKKVVSDFTKPGVYFVSFYNADGLELDYVDIEIVEEGSDNKESGRMGEETQPLKQLNRTKQSSPTIQPSVTGSVLSDIGWQSVLSGKFTRNRRPSSTLEPTVKRFFQKSDRPTFKRLIRPLPSPTTSPTRSPTLNTAVSTPTIKHFLFKIFRPKNDNTATIPPSTSPTTSPTPSPTRPPTLNPTTSLTPNPTKSPTLNPTKSATQNPTGPPTPNPTTPQTPSPVASTATGEPNPTTPPTP